MNVICHRVLLPVLVALAPLAGVLPDLRAAPADAAAGTPRPVAIDYFYEPGCDACEQVERDLLPVLQARYGGLYELRPLDLGEEQHYLELTAYLERFGVDDNAHVFMVVDGTRVLAGVDAIAANLFSALDASLAAPPQARAEASRAPPPDRELVQKRFQRFTLAGVVVGGLVDGINPCAISTLVFLASVLTMAGVRGRRLLVVGGAFCLASFLTYLAIGFGLLRAVHALYHFRTLRKAVDLGMVLLLATFAFYSARDAFRYHRSGKAGDVALKLPNRVRTAIHRLLRLHLGERAQAGSAFVIGAAVTGLETVCTGQVYVPTLTLVVKSGMATGRAVSLLLIYNLMFALPLLVVLGLTYQGLKLPRLLAWSRNNVVLSKILLAAFFIGLACMILALG